ncbi:ABC transporter ATP-binding protein [Thiococcus pfennigii]|uniref:ABC transporter ATP-binding protein n=1 Tax=Thiococcus pfennigii TaxID=1057 RepID=UPI001907B735|nr:ABC transporter ATP-binding protein [Thiococcus pfennigii]MBK1700094.1 cobalamin ABC transporter ATP-binding protein [Thiococcus pfennigii]MBK1732986.1 cobalamin ABC transporter ATP-binding protein [Thiococcus pfennigii]
MIRIRNLTMDYGRGAVLAGLDLDLAPGPMVGLIGPNGAGKSTLLKLLMGLMRPSGGTIALDGRPLPGYRRRALAQRVTLVPQDTRIGFAFRVEEIVAMGRNPHLGRFEVPGEADLARIRRAMVQTGIAALAERPVDTLSSGERQRAIIARAIAQETRVLLLDEVTANLDLCHQLAVLELVRDLARGGRLVVAAIHDLTLAARFCDRLILLADGRVGADGAPHTVLTEANLRRFFGVEARVETGPGDGDLRITALRAA